ncbi:hypothetical protein [Synechococcus sp. CBW1004]|jgi:uncharacterized protein HemX|uniref:hypothetical protein n=1 Tax=Synechococcus sp. CBW1004 TaxID=1353136 RepID=UPI0018CE8BDA|nr:hypothetical protein [Synechococcus sp. CBW1004]QPN63547.1 hypothetical protein H8F25_01230 [Synechococcus sp. CBW1004]
MAPSRDHSTGGSTVMASALAGAVVGAAGLAWWLLSTAERRRQARHHLQQLRQAGLPGLRTASQAQTLPAGDAQLHDRVQQLNAAIDEVRRQLEQLQTQP